MEKKVLVIGNGYSEEEAKNKVVELIENSSDLYLKTDNGMWVHLMYQKKYEMLQITVLDHGHLECCGFINDPINAIIVFDNQGYFESKHMRIEFVETGGLLLTFL